MDVARSRWTGGALRDSGGAFLLLACAFAASGCAASASGGRPGIVDDTPQVETFRAGGLRPVEYVVDPGIGSFIVPASAEEAWSVLGKVYGAMGIPVTDSDPDAREMGNRAHATRRIQGQRLSVFLDCGRDLSGPLVNRYDITLSVATKVVRRDPVPASNALLRSELVTVVSASGKPRSTSGNTVPCTSTGALEKLIADEVEKAVLAGS